MSIIHLRDQPLPFVKQSKPSSCGAACLAMIYQSFGFQISEPEVFNSVIGTDARSGQNCRTYLMCQDAISRGFHATAFFSNDIRSTIKSCRAHDIELILLFHSAPQSLCAHFCVVNNVLPGGVYLKDPELNATEERNLRFRDLDNLAKATGLPGDDICHDYTMIAVSNHSSASNRVCTNRKCNHFIPILDEIQIYMDKFVCPYCDRVYSI